MFCGMGVGFQSPFQEHHQPITEDHKMTTSGNAAHAVLSTPVGTDSLHLHHGPVGPVDEVKLILLTIKTVTC